MSSQNESNPATVFQDIIREYQEKFKQSSGVDEAVNTIRKACLLLDSKNPSLENKMSALCDIQRHVKQERDALNVLEETELSLLFHWGECEHLKPASKIQDELARRLGDIYEGPYDAPEKERSIVDVLKDRFKVNFAFNNQYVDLQGSSVFVYRHKEGQVLLILPKGEPCLRMVVSLMTPEGAIFLDEKMPVTDNTVPQVKDLQILLDKTKPLQ